MPAVTISFRALEQADLPTVTELFASEEELSPYARETLDDALLVGWLAVEGECIVGAVLTRTMRSDDDRERGGVDELLVADSHRRLGVGRRLMELAEAHYRAMGVAGMQLSVTEANRPAARLYDSLGYIVVLRYLRPGATAGRPPEARLRMWKDF